MLSTNLYLLNFTCVRTANLCEIVEYRSDSRMTLFKFKSINVRSQAVCVIVGTDKIFLYKIVYQNIFVVVDIDH